MPRGIRENKVLVKLTEPASGFVEYKPTIVSPRPESNGLVVFRISERWTLDARSKRTLRAVPYIDRNGLIHATTVCWWRCSSYQLYATIVATVYKRLKHLVSGIHNRKKRCKDTNLLLKIALHYSATNDDSWYKRCLAMLYGTNKNLLSFVYYKIKSVDANKGFLYDQALNNASWFKRHSRFSRKCDKSTFDVWKNRYPTYHLPVEWQCSGGLVRCLTYYMHSQWARVYHVATESVSHYSAINPLFRG
jgi:hypothetical protein